jgi:hypothetical protein
MENYNSIAINMLDLGLWFIAVRKNDPDAWMVY